MTQENYIKDTQLPLELDFKALKAAGLAYIQKHSSQEWTNLNPSDPGVTILEQLCYAFTELGYCANFSIKDILTDKNGNLIVNDQFFLPQNILTITPITIDDYTKFIIDQVPSVKNVIITTVTCATPFVSRLYKVYLLLDSNETDTLTDITEFNTEKENETFYLLNSCRNVGELFLKPSVFKPKQYTIKGKLVLESDADFDTVLSQIIQNINAYIFPEVTQTGYDKLKEEGVATNDIFNGPTLDNGWITSESIQPKKDSIQPFEITKLIQEVQGVQSISGVSLWLDGAAVQTAHCNTDEILIFSFLQATTPATISNFEISTQGKSLNSAVNLSLIDELAMMQQENSQVNEVAAVQMAPKVPTGKYRDIASYYSIQNTFPEAFAVGLNATNDSTPAYQIAQSRQLKGYLSLFDQVLSNQFAQLANIDKLFSFKNAITGATADLEQYNNIRTPEEKAHPTYPAPFEVFSPTYFYQSLYKSVPNVSPLLRDNDIFDFGPTSESDVMLAHRSWLAYQDNPYNSYMYGLLLFNENDDVNLQRRNDLLDHLLARHGESPAIIDTLIYGTVYSGDYLKDRVIIKSIYLQNLELLSYNRTKAYNVIGAQLLNDFVLTITPQFIKQLKSTTATEFAQEIQTQLTTTLEETQAQRATAIAKAHTLQISYDIAAKSYKNEGIFNINRITKEEKISQQDTLNYTTISLKLSMLLTLQPFCINFIQEAFHQDVSEIDQTELSKILEEVEMTLWLLSQRKGMIALETAVLLQSANYQVYFKDSSENIVYYRLNTILNYEEYTELATSLDAIGTQDISSYLTSINPTYTLTETQNTQVENTSFITIDTTKYAWTASVASNDTEEIFVTNPLFENTLLWVFPNYLPEIVTTDWQHRLSYFTETQLPLHISAGSFYATADDLKTFIPQYVRWFNANIYNTSTQSYDITTAATSASEIILTLSQLSQNITATHA
ncbi:hypothetical protein C8N46_101669 [Kordia periserrulae]|uniref:Uncharacterized protein n=1 Tax=Kordia periserrulae TaxID=701523 RepID=A0A2T6C6W0_9FLAO|nr:hypothetical protein [Kordia periserrulae]PTX64059.1 hypothetical protein C8N46_101669 [Kordia periserrulae]